MVEVRGYSKQVGRNEGDIDWMSATTSRAGGAIKYLPVKKGTTTTHAFKDFVDIRELPDIARQAGIAEIFLAGNGWELYGMKGYGEKVSIPEFERLLKAMGW